MSYRDSDGWSNRSFLSEIADLTPFTENEREYILLYQECFAEYTKLQTLLYGPMEKRVSRDDPEFNNLLDEYQSIDNKLIELENSKELTRVLKIIKDQKMAELGRRAEAAREKERRENEERVKEICKKWEVSRANAIETRNLQGNTQLNETSYENYSHKNSIRQNTNMKTNRFDAFFLILHNYRKIILIIALLAFVLTIGFAIGYTVFENTMHSAHLHYESTGGIGVVGCGSNSCTYCRGTKMLNSEYRGPYSFPYYSKISNNRFLCETFIAIFAFITVVTSAMYIAMRIKFKKNL